MFLSQQVIGDGQYAVSDRDQRTFSANARREAPELRG